MTIPAAFAAGLFPDFVNRHVAAIKPGAMSLGHGSLGIKASLIFGYHAVTVCYFDFRI